MKPFTATTPTLDAFWRAIILFGRNSASYKFALASALLEVTKDPVTFISLADLAGPYARALAAHLRTEPRQGTASSSKFLNAIREYNIGEIGEPELLERTVRFGFQNVIDAFHVVNQGDIPVRFFADDRQGRGGIVITDELLSLQRLLQIQNLPQEVEARWRLVETAWTLNIPLSTMVIRPDAELECLVLETPGGRKNLTACRDALNGYQKGRCFYCFREITVAVGDDLLADVDHFFPISLSWTLPLLDHLNLNGIWNLVLACRECNRGPRGKATRVPNLACLERLHTRNQFLISSHHPLRETLMAQTGASDLQRRAFLQRVDQTVFQLLIHRWTPSVVSAPAF